MTTNDGVMYACMLLHAQGLLDSAARTSKTVCCSMHNHCFVLLHIQTVLQHMQTALACLDQNAAVQTS